MLESVSANVRCGQPWTDAYDVKCQTSDERQLKLLCIITMHAPQILVGGGGGGGQLSAPGYIEPVYDS